MKVTPAHTIEARQMADSLLHEIIDNDFPINISLESTETEATIFRIREYMSIAFGWSSWGEMNKFILLPHEPVYLDDNQELLEEIVLRLSKCIGYDYAHGTMFSFIENSGAGFSPAKRRELAALASPWGIIQDQIEIAPGLVKVSTASHGGYVLSESRMTEIPNHLSLNSKYYEEDCERALIELSFPEYFTDSLAYALATIDLFNSASIPKYQTEEELKWMEDNLSHSFSSFFGRSKNKVKTPNRDMTELEQRVVHYLSLCVLRNRVPIKTPHSYNPTLQDWCDCLENAMKVNDEWPLGKKNWKKHFWPEDE
ncbi:TPA: hypothetical protein RUZ39_003226 [Vibrio cholerae]|nr:hypothetical protein [Vibrio cholerae]